MSTMLDIVQAATGELGLAVPVSVAGSTAQDTIQQLALLNAVGHELVREPAFDWQALTTEYRFTSQWTQQTAVVTLGSAVITMASTANILANTWMVTGNGIAQDTYVKSVDSATQITMTQNAQASGPAVLLTFAQTKYAFPADYQRIIDRTQWDKSKHWEMLGPESPQQWQWLKSGYISTGPRIRWRILGNTFQIWPGVSTSEYLGFEYVSKFWAIDGVTGASKAAFTLDSDTAQFDTRLMVAGLKLKYFGIKGFETQILQDEYDAILASVKGEEQGAPILSFAPQPSSILLGPENIPDSGYGV
jgi:hypothetical protein